MATEEQDSDTTGAVRQYGEQAIEVVRGVSSQGMLLTNFDRLL